jgi:bacillolysin
MNGKFLEHQVHTMRERDPSIAITYTADRGALALARGRLSEPFDMEKLVKSPFDCALGFLREHAVLIGELDVTTLSNVHTTTDRRGMTHVLLQQLHGQAEVVGATVSIHFDEQGTVRMLKSSLALGINLPEHGEIEAEQAAEIAVEHAGKGAAWVRDHRPRLVVLTAKLVHRDKREQPYYLCWMIGIAMREMEPLAAEWLYYIDAITGDVLQRTTTIQTGTGTGHFSHGTDVISEASGNDFILKDAATSSTWPVTTKPILHTYDDAGETTSVWLTDYSTDNNDKWDTLGPPAVDCQAHEVDIHRFLGYVMDYYYLTLNRNSWDGAGADIKGHAHHESLPDNAFWWSVPKQLYFSDTSTCSHLGALDVVAHEFTHGVSYGFNIIQWYHVETGALNEALSDIFGCFIALAHPLDEPEPWIHGDLAHPPGRNLADPSRDTSGMMQYDATNDTTKFNSAIAGYFPDHYSIRYTGPDDKWHDYGGVHINAPIVTHALYLMVIGGIHRLGVTVIGIGQNPVEEMLYHVMSTPGMLNNTSDFNDFRIAMITACMDLYPDDLDYLVTVKTAFYAVGIGPDLFARDTLADQGDEPGTLSCMSPDIICRQDLANATTLTQIADTSNSSLGQDIDLAKGDHHMYFRIFNRGAEEASGTFRLFISPVSTFPTPNNWHEVGHFDFPAVPAGGLWVPSNANECITLTAALASSLGTGHFCFIGIIEATVDPSPDRNLIDNVNEFHDYIRKSNNYVWRNCDITGVAPAPSGVIPAQTNGFQINGFGRKTEFRQLEVDARELPRDTRLVIWVPRERFFGVKAVTVQPLTPVELPRNVAGMLAPLPSDLDPAHLVPAPLGRFAQVPDALKIKPKQILAKDLALWHALEITPGQVTRFRGIQLRAGEIAQIYFTLQFPRNVGARDVTLVFREMIEDKLLGQMNYVYRVRNRKR